VNVHPSAVENIVRQHREVDEFQMVLTREGYQDEMAVNLDFDPAVPPSRHAEISYAVARELAEAHEGLRFKVAPVEAGSLPRFELKSRRLVDRR
jgi:phenylacetate-CoA ligase